MHKGSGVQPMVMLNCSLTGFNSKMIRIFKLVNDGQ